MARGLYGGIQSKFPAKEPDLDPPASTTDRHAGGVRRAGLWLMVLALFLPYAGCGVDPEDVRRDELGWFDASPGKAFVPAGRFEDMYREWYPDPKVRSGQFIGGADKVDDNGFLVLLAAPLWGLALVAAGSPRRRFRRAADLLLHAGIACLLYLAIGELVRNFSWHGVGIVAGGLVLLAARPRGMWRLGEVEATVSTQALVGLGFVFLSPTLLYFEWVYDKGEPAGLALLALRHKYRIGFLAASAGLSLVAAPLYLSGERMRRLYDALDLWRSRWWTRTRTSTSTGSTPTATRSSTGPGPPGSSPS